MDPEKLPVKEGSSPETQQTQPGQTLKFEEPPRRGRKRLVSSDPDASRRPSITQVISEKEKKRRKKQKDEEKKNVDIDEHR
jgi:hypothetical protein